MVRGGLIQLAAWGWMMLLIVLFWHGWQKTRALVLFCALFYSALAVAHPEDDLCDPSRDAMDPQLCAMLAQLNSADGALNQQTTFRIAARESEGVLETLGRFVLIGIGHILPGGLDHILFVLAIFLAAVCRQSYLANLRLYLSAYDYPRACCNRPS